MVKAKRIKRMEITDMSMGEIIRHLEHLRWLLHHNKKPPVKRYPGLTNISEAKANAICDHITDAIRYLDNIPGTTIYDFFTDDDFKAYGIH
mgnify:CR=1 FL=1